MKQTIVFLHGGPDHKEEWNKVIHLLGDYNCLAMDLPGFGLTGKVAKDFDFSIQSQVDYFDSWITRNVSADKFLLVGHDIGAVLSLAWASENSHRVRGLLLMNTVTDKNFKWHTMGKIWGHPIIGPLFMFLVNNRFFAYGFSNDFPELSQADVQNIIKGLTPSARRSLLRLFRKMTAPGYFDDWEEKFRKVVTEVPTTVLWGQQDPLVAEEYAYQLGGKVVMIEDGGHWVPREKPELVAEQIKNRLH